MAAKILLFFITGISLTWMTFARQNDSLEQSMKRGKEIYTANCAGCHMPEGEGVDGTFPPLAKTDYLKNQARLIGIILHGQEGEITVNGATYSVPMDALPQLKDQEVADVLNYISNSWSNKNPMIKAARVNAERKQ